MITKFEQYNKPEVGDYVLIRTESSYFNFNKFINNNIGILIKYVQYRRLSAYTYRIEKIINEPEDIIVQYEYIPNGLKSWLSKDKTRQFRVDQIVAFGKTKEDVELQIQANKYNI
jgi:hypothetical protein